METRIAGLRVRYDDSGEPGLVPLVFIHGFPFDLRMWEPQLAALRGKARLVAYDLRGFGGSEAGDGQYLLESYVDDLLALLDHLRLDKAVLCGLSMGGYVALRAAEKTPSRARGLVLCDTKSEADTDEGKVKRSAAIAQVKKGGMAAFAETFLPGALAPETLKAGGPAVRLARELIASADPKGACAALIAMAGRTDTTASLCGIAMPTLVLVGEKDVLTPPAAARALAGRIPGARLKVIPGAGHLSSLENPDAFNRELTGFLERLS